jgi:hypothetical protein
MDMAITLDRVRMVESKTHRTPTQVRIVAAQRADGNAVVAHFGALHAYNASLDPHFALADGWQTLLRRQFSETWQAADRL